MTKQLDPKGPTSGAGAASRWLGNLFETAPVQDALAQSALQRLKATSGGDALAKALAGLLEESQAELDCELADLDKALADIDKEENTMLAQYRREVVTFLIEAQPGPLSELARQVLREHLSLLDKLRCTATALSSQILQALAQR